MRGKGINYDTGFYPGQHATRTHFAPSVVAAEMRVIARELGCTAVRVSGGDPARLSTAAEFAAAEGLEVWFAPFPCELAADQMIPVFAECAERAERLRRAGARVVLVTGCELSLFATGFMPGQTAYDRIDRLVRRKPRSLTSLSRLPGRLNDFLGAAADAARIRFAGPVTYASGTWEKVDWDHFDIVAVDAYRDSANASRYRSALRTQLRPGKPLVVTEFGCCAYAGAADRGGMGWAIADDRAERPMLDGTFVRDESEQVRYLSELLAIFADEGVDLAFWFTFASYDRVRDADPRRDLDMASYGVVTMLPGGPGTGYQGLGWEPRQVFRALAAATP